MYINGKEQSKAGMKSSIEYVGKDSKTMLKLEDGTAIKLVSGQNVTPETAYEEFIATKETFGKTDKRQFYHVVQSFSPDEEIKPEEVHEAGVSLAKYFDGYEVLIATHIDRDHRHNHLIINSVNAQTGKKFSEGIKGIYGLRRYSDNICKHMNLSVLPDKEKSDVKGIKTGEYRAAKRGDSWKFALMNVIDTTMANTKTKAEFIKHMNDLGYEVKWTDTRKNITYIHPNGKKVCDDKLHDERYLKREMEGYYEKFRRAETAQQTRGNGTQTISADNLCDTTGAMGSNGSNANPSRATSENSGWLSESHSEQGRNATGNENLVERIGELASGKCDPEIPNIENGNSKQDDRPFTAGQVYRAFQNEYFGDDIISQFQVDYTCYSAFELIDSSLEILRQLGGADDYIQNSFNTVDLTDLKGIELFNAIKELKDHAEDIKLRNERIATDKRDSQELEALIKLLEMALEKIIEENNLNYEPNETMNEEEIEL
jgi:hypothetical protein